MVKYLTAAFDWLWNLKGLEGVRHKVFRWIGVGLSAYLVLSTDEKSPFVGLPDVAPTYAALFFGWLSTKGIEFAKAHPKG